MFRFKQFSVDQSGCAMKINTDGVLLGALAVADNPESILDIGTGTGVIALMLAQKYTAAKVDAVEIDTDAAHTAERNFKLSTFADILTLYANGFESYFDQYPESKYDLIVSNPPFYIDSLKSPGAKKTLAKHTDVDFFERLIKHAASHLTVNGSFWIIIPVALGAMVIKFAEEYSMYPVKIINIRSYPDYYPHRSIINFGANSGRVELNELTIYDVVGIYTDEYKKLLQPYFINF